MFWNLNKKPIEQLVADAVHENHVDILILAECEITVETLLSTLNQNQIFYYCESPTEKVLFFTKFSPDQIVWDSDGSSTSIRRYVPQNGEDIILVGVHSHCKLFSNTDDQIFEATILSDEIREAELKYKHRRTIVVGDFNMNPFESGMIGARGLHGMMDRQQAMKGVRIVDGIEYKYMYNPMWSLFGDLSKGPPGTYYYGGSKQVNYFWYMFDQVLIGSELIEKFMPDSLKIITSISGISLLNRNSIPDKSVGSDHLPIIFTMELCNERRI